MSSPSSTIVWPGRPYPLGANWDGEGVNFALFSEHAEQVVLCLFDARGKHEIEQIPCANKPAGSGTLICRTLGPACCMVTGCRGRIGRRKVTVSTRISCCSIPTPRPSSVRFNGAMPSSATGSAVAPRI